MIYFWTEDRKDKSGYQFWSTFLKILYPNVILESKTNSSELVKSVAGISSNEIYIIALDHSFDNDQAIREIRQLRNIARQKKNVYELNLISFEYMLLSLPMLIEWIYAPEDEFREKRKNFIAIRKKLVEAINKEADYKEIPEIIEWLEEIQQYNIEQIASKLLFELTRNTGFFVNKGCLGDCWKIDCCNWESRTKNDKCGLDADRLSLSEKMQMINKESCLIKEFKQIGLEMAI